MELERIRLALEVDSAAWAAGLRGAATQLGGFGAQVDGIVGKITGVTSKLGAAGTAFGAFGAGMALAFAASIGPAIEFEQAFTGVLKTVNGSQAQLATVRDGILDMSRTMPIAATEIAGVAEAAGQLGVATGDILGFSETMIKLGVTTNLTAEQAATSLARFSNIMGTSTSDVDKLGATIAYLGNNFATTESEIVNWGLRLAGAGAVAGATEAEVLAIGAAMSSLGINAEMGATAISTVWMEMTKAVETGSPKLQTFAETAGMTSEAFASMFESNPTQALNEFVTGLGRVETEGGSAVLVLDQLGLDGARMSQVLLSASSAGDNLAVSIEGATRAFRDGVALNDEYGKFAETTAARIEILKGKFKALAVEVGTPALGAVVTVIDGIGVAVDFLVDKVGPAASEVAEFAGKVAGAGAVLVASLGAPILQVIGGAIIGLATSVEVLFAVLNEIPGAAGAAAAGIAFFAAASTVGGVSAVSAAFVSLGQALGAAAISGTLAGTGLGSAAAGMASITLAAAPVAAVAAFAAVVALMGLNARNAKERADEFASSLTRLSVNAEGQVTMDGLAQATLAAADAYYEAAEKSGGFLNTVKEFAGILPGVSDASLDNALTLREAGTVAVESANQFKLLQDTYATVGMQFGLTADQVERLALVSGIDPSGFLDPATWNDTFNALYEVTQASAELADTTGTTIDQLTNASESVTQFGLAAGLTAPEIGYLADAFDIDLAATGDDLANAKTQMLLAAEAARASAESVGGMGDAYLQAAGHTYELVNAHTALGEVMSGIGARRQAMVAQTQALATAEANLAAALESGDPAAVAQAYGDLAVAQGSMQTSVEGVNGVVAANIDAFRDWGHQVGLTDEQIGSFALNWIALTEHEKVDLVITGMEQLSEAEQMTLLLKLSMLDLNNTKVRTDIEANTDGARERVADLASEYDLWDQATVETFLMADGDEAIRMVNELLLALGQIPATRSVMIEVSSNISGASLAWRASGGGGGLASLADGGIVGYADGGLAEAFAAGGVVRERPGTAGIYRPASKYRIFAEPETGGEAYIPLAASKRGRSRAIWRETGHRLGMFADGGIADRMRYLTGGIADAEAFANGGVTSGSFSSGVFLPTIHVGVEIDSRGAGELSTTLGGVASAIGKVKSVADGLPASFQASFGTLEEIAASTGLSLEEVRRIAADAFGQAAVEAESSSERMYRAFADAGIGIEQVAHDAGRALVEEMDPTEFLAQMERITGWLASDLGPVLEGFNGDIGDTIDWIESMGLSMDEVFSTVFLEAADDIDILTSALGLLESAMNDTDSAARDLTDSMDFLNGRQLDLITAQNDATLAVARFQKMIDDGKTSTDQFTEAGARTSDEMIRLGETLAGLVIEVAKSGAGFEATEQAMATQIETFRRLATAAGFTEEQIAKYVELLFTMPADIVTNVTVEAGEELATVEAFKQAMEELDGFLAIPDIQLNDADATARAVELQDRLTELGLTQTVVTVDAETGQATVDVEAVGNLLNDLASGATVVMIDGNPVPAEDAVALVRGLLEGLVSAPYDAQLSATDSASPVVSTAQGNADTFASRPYDATLTATDSASGTIDSTRSRAEGYASGRYDGNLTATDSASGTIEGTRGKAASYATTYNATLTVTDNASGMISRAQGAASGFAGTYTATLITNRIENVITNNLPSRPPPAAANGMLTLAGGFRAMAAGDILHRNAMMMPGRSNILWAEDIDGESYIPHAPWKRERSTRLLAETAGLFGYGLHRRGAGYGPAAGPTVVVNSDFAPQVVLNGVSDERVARTVATQIEREFKTFHREMSLSLVGRH